MTGPEHYAEAEQILYHAEDCAMDNTDEWYANAVAAAQVHATLALVAAQAEPWVGEGDGEHGVFLHRDWAKALS